MICRVIVFCTLWLVFSASMANDGLAGEITIQFMNKVTSEKTDFCLRDIASISSTDAGLSKTLGAVVVGKTPRVGYSKRVTRNAVMPKLASVYPGIYRSIHWAGEDYVTIKGVGVEYKAERYLGHATSALTAWLQEKYHKVSISKVGTYKDLAVPAGEITLKPRLSSAMGLKRRMKVWVDVLVDGTQYQTIPVWFAVQAYGPALVANSKMPAGSVISAADFYQKEVDLSLVDGTPVVSLDKLKTMRLKKTVYKGDVVTRNNIEVLPNVLVGQKVAVTANVGNVSIRTTAIALEDGKIGDRIKVKTMDNSSEYQVNVIGSRLVTVDGN